MSPVTASHGRAGRSAFALAGLVTSMLVLALFTMRVHPFLATSAPVRADIMVVEGWVPAYVLDRAIIEFQRGGYRHMFVAELEPAASERSESSADYLVRHGIDPAVITVAAAPNTRWNRTSRMAQTVSLAIRSTGQQPIGVNVITLGPHGRQSRLAYRRMLGPETPVGVITVPKDDYDPARWWANDAGVRKTLKDLAGWLRELLFGLRP